MKFGLYLLLWRVVILSYCCSQEVMIGPGQNQLDFLESITQIDIKSLESIKDFDVSKK